MLVIKNIVMLFAERHLYIVNGTQHCAQMLRHIPSTQSTQLQCKLKNPTRNSLNVISLTHNTIYDLYDLKQTLLTLATTKQTMLMSRMTSPSTLNDFITKFYSSVAIEAIELHQSVGNYQRFLASPCPFDFKQSMV